MSKEYLEAIDNANHSEALKTLEKLDKIISPLLEPVLAEYEDDLSDKITANYFALKQALLKSQKPKHYLKWDDIEFSYGTKIQKVKMGDTIYKIECVYYDNVKEVKLLSEDEKCYYLGFTGNYKDNVQLFNDLHLEVVE